MTPAELEGRAYGRLIARTVRPLPDDEDIRPRLTDLILFGIYWAVLARARYLTAR